jgi:hypothetical protein
VIATGFAGLFEVLDIIANVFGILAAGTWLALVMVGALGVATGGVALRRVWRRASIKAAWVLVSVMVVGGVMMGVAGDRLVFSHPAATAGLTAAATPSPTPPPTYLVSLTPTEPAVWPRDSIVMDGLTHGHSMYATICPPDHKFAAQTFDVAGRYSRLRARVALAPDSKNTTPMVFEVIANSRATLFRHSVSLSPIPVDVPLDGVQQLQLKVGPDPQEPVSQYGCVADARAVWADPYLLR